MSKTKLEYSALYLIKEIEYNKTFEESNLFKKSKEIFYYAKNKIFRTFF